MLGGAADLATIQGDSGTSGLGNASHLDAVFRFETFKLKELAVFGYDISYPSVDEDYNWRIKNINPLYQKLVEASKPKQSKPKARSK